MNMRHVLTLLLCAITCFHSTYGIVSTLNNNDPLPLFHSHAPHDYLTTHIKQSLRQNCIDEPCYECDRPYDRFLFSIGGFHQKASRGRDFDKQRVPLGNIAGRWHMLGLLYGKVPPGHTLIGKQLGCAKEIIFSDIMEITENTEIPEKETLLDPNQLVGFFSVPIKYQKTGFRFALEFAILPCGELGIGIYGGAASIKQTVTSFIDLTPTPTGVTSIKQMQMDPLGDENDKKVVIPDGFLDFTPTGTRICNIREQLMDPCKANKIFREICQDPCDVKQMSFEDLHIVLWGRHIFRINECCDPCYPSLSIIPFANLQVSLPLADKKDRTKLLSLPFGNDKHFAIGGTAGFIIDFYETIEIGFSGGITHFFSHDFNKFRVPNHEKQSGIFPFFTDVKRHPGRNIRFDAHLTAHHFLCLLSGWVQYSFVCHDEDQIILKNESDKKFYKPEILECVTKWESQVLNTGATYDISPNIALGLVVQWPIMQRNAYRATTVLGTIQVEF